jgi:hypothetical protein
VTTPLDPVTHKVEMPVQQILLGIALLLAGGAFLLSWRNARAISKSKQHISNTKGKD